MQKDLTYYATQDKVYWVVANDVFDIKGNILFKQYEKIPCIFVQNLNNRYYILQFQENIKQDSFRYTAWRKLLGKIYNARVDVLLIKIFSKHIKLYTLAGKIVNFEDLGKSNIQISDKYLAKFSIK